MGCDGGSIPTRREQVKTKKKERSTKEETNIVSRNFWLTCSFSSQPLKDPIVCDRLGNIFNKTDILEGIVGKKLDDNFKHIKGMKDLVHLQLTKNPDYSDKACSSGSENSKPSLFICPITGLETNGRHTFSAIATCGHVLSDKALREVPSQQCLVCQTSYDTSDIIPLNPTKEQLEQLKESLKAYKKLKRKEKKTEKESKKKRKRESEKEDDKKVKIGLSVNEVLQEAKSNHEKYKNNDVYKSLFSETKKVKT